MKKIIFSLMFGIFLISLVSAEESNLGTFKLNECVELYQQCDNCTYVNLTSVKLPNSTNINIGLNMTKNGEDYTYTFCNTTSTGNYQYNVCGDKNGINKCEVIEFSVTPSGNSIDSGQSISLFGSLILIIIVGLILLFVAVKSKGVVAKISFYTFSTLAFVMAILYTVITIQQTLFGFESILTGIETFWSVSKIGMGIAFIGLLIVIFLVMLKAWKIKRGLYDTD